MFDYFLTYDIKNCYLLSVIFSFFDILRRITTFIRTSFGVFHGGAKVTSLLKFRVLNHREKHRMTYGKKVVMRHKMSK